MTPVRLGEILPWLADVDAVFVNRASGLQAQILLNCGSVPGRSVRYRELLVYYPDSGRFESVVVSLYATVYINPPGNYQELTA